MYKSYELHGQSDVVKMLEQVNKEHGKIICTIDRPLNFTHLYVIYEVGEDQK